MQGLFELHRLKAVLAIFVGTVLLSACAELSNPSLQPQTNNNASQSSLLNSKPDTNKAYTFGVDAMLLADAFREQVYFGDSRHGFVHFAKPKTFEIANSVFVGGETGDMWMGREGRYLHVRLDDLEHVAVIDVERAVVVERKRSIITE